MLFGPVSGATPGPGNPVFNFVVGGGLMTAIWVQYRKRKQADKPSIRTVIFMSAIAAVFIALGIWGLISPG